MSKTSKQVAIVRNGVRQPRQNTIIGAVWSLLDTATGEVNSKHIPIIAEQTGLNETTVRIQFYRHRKFNGK